MIFCFFSSASMSASWAPSASPSGFLWTEINIVLQGPSASTMLSRSLIGRVLLLLVLFQLAEQFHDVGAPFQRGVKTEEKLRDKPHPHSSSELQANKGRGALETLEGFLFVPAVDAHEHLCVSQVISHLDIGHCNETDTGVLDLAHEDIGDLLFHLVADAL